MSGDSSTSATMPEVRASIWKIQRQYINASICREVNIPSEALVEIKAGVKQAFCDMSIQRRASSDQG